MTEPDQRAGESFEYFSSVLIASTSTQPVVIDEVDEVLCSSQLGSCKPTSDVRMDLFERFRSSMGQERERIGNSLASDASGTDGSEERQEVDKGEAVEDALFEHLPHGSLTRVAVPFLSILDRFIPFRRRLVDE